MKLFYHTILLMAVLFVACHKDNHTHLDDHHSHNGIGNTLILEFDHFVGSDKLVLEDSTSINYKYTNYLNQKFNLTKLGYYISAVKLEGSNGEKYEDTAHKSYLIEHINGENPTITLKNVPSGNYSKAIFTVGIAESLHLHNLPDTTKKAWFFNWNEGFSNFKIQGKSAESPQSNKGFLFDIVGWKNEQDSNSNLVYANNTKIITLNFNENAKVASNLAPMAHFVVDVLKIIDGATIDFNKTYSISNSISALPLANELTNTFIFEHTHN